MKQWWERKMGSTLFCVLKQHNQCNGTAAYVYVSACQCKCHVERFIKEVIG